jgi:aminoglycoside phosphotransferase (APT) family kinase protein
LSQAPTSGSYRVRLEDGSSVIAKLYVEQAGWKAFKEASIVAALGRIDWVRTTTVLRCGWLADHSAAALITADLGPCTLWQAVDKGRYSREEALGLVGQQLAAFHRIGLDSLPLDARPDQPVPRTPAVELACHVQRLRMAGDESCGGHIMARVAPALDRIEGLGEQMALVWCHGDLHPANVIARADQDRHAAYLVDFAATTRRPREYDIAQSLVTSGACGEWDRRAVLAGYRSGHALVEELVDAFMVFHTVNGWLYAALAEQRDRSLWQARIQQMLEPGGPLF